MKIRPWPLVLLLAPILAAQDFQGLPAWAAARARLAATYTPPADADAWIILDRTEFAYRGNGEIRMRNFRLVKILTERGLDQAWYVLHGLGGSASKVKSLRGWNLRPDGEVEVLNRDFTATFTRGSARAITPKTTTVGVLARAAKGSLVAFESEESILNPVGPLDSTTVLEANPILRWELELVKSVGWLATTAPASVGVHLEARHFQPWFPAPDPGVTTLGLSEIPPLPRGEAGAPGGILPMVFLSFTDPSLKGAADLSGWDGFARWNEGLYRSPDPPFRPVDLGQATGPGALAALHRWIRRELTYRQVYLTPDRNWRPEAPAEVLRHRFGDGKDLAGFFIAAVRGAGMEAFPVLARIGNGRLEADEPVGPFSFDHAIAAVRLEAPSGLPAEVETPLGRFLLVDLTDRYSPLGWLSEAHRGGRVLICTPRGGAWVEVPPQAIPASRVEANLEAAPTPEGGLKGTLRLTERGRGLGLRHLALTGGARLLRERCAMLIGLPAGTRWELEPPGDPLDGQEAFAVRITFEAPLALAPFGTGWLLPRIGLLPDPDPIQKLDRPRRLPVTLPAGPAWEYTAELVLPEGLGPAIPEARLETPLRTATWSARRKGAAWTLRFTEAPRAAAYPFERREAGVRDQREDWKRRKAFLDDALTVQTLPPEPPASTPPGKPAQAPKAPPRKRK